MKEHIIIIGGGLGGLFTGAILAKEGYQITIFEKNLTIGGGLQTFKRNGETFATGMHILGGFRKNQSIRILCTYLNIWKDLTLMDVDSDCMDTIFYLSDNKHYRIAEGRENFAESLAKEFPHERDNLKRYVDALYKLTEGVDLFHLRSTERNLFSHPDEFFWAADDFIAHYIKDEKLRDILGYMNALYGGVAKHTPAYIHAIINTLYINGPSRFAGESQQLADALEHIITETGGKVYHGTPINYIEVEEKEVKYIVDDKGNKHTADRYISAIHPCAMLSIMKEDAFPRSYKTRINSIPSTISAFSVYLILKKDTFPYINHTCYCQDDYGLMWNFSDQGDNWPQGFMYMTPPDKNQGPYATKMTITAPMSFELARKWEDTTIGKRGSEYEAWKEECTEKLLSKLEVIYPNIRECIDKIYTASPLTIRDYYNVKEGAMYGFRKDCEQLALSQIPIYTKIKNLLLTGQNINLHGICGVPLTAIKTAEAIIGEDVILNKINKQYNE